MIEKIKDNLYALSFEYFGSIVYYLILEGEKIIIDTSSEVNKEELIEDLKKLNVSPEEIDIVILTHDHFDHTGNIKLFKNAKFFGSKEDFNVGFIEDIENLGIKDLRVIKSPGHTKGSICLYYLKEKILFSGDTIFHRGFIGRTDLPNSIPEKMAESLEFLKQIDYEILCPGH